MRNRVEQQSGSRLFQNSVAPLDQYDVPMVIGLVALYTLVFLVFLRPPFLSDQLDYFYHAANPSELGSSHRHLRIGLVWLSWAFVQLFGYSELSYYAVPYLAALAFGLGTWLLGRVLFGRWVGVTAAILIIVNPWVAANLTHLIPDYLGAGLFTVGVALIIWLAQAGRLEMMVDRAALITLYISGVLIGWSYLSREFVAVLFPIIPLVLLAVGARILLALPIALGALTCWMAELAWGWIKYGNPFIRLLGASPRETERVFATEPLDIFLQLPSIFHERSGGWVFAALLLLAATVSIILGLKGERRWQVIAAWLIGGWVFFTTVALVPPLILEDRVLLRMHKFRYWAILLPPLFVGGLGALQHLLQVLAAQSQEKATKNRVFFAIGLTILSLGIASPTWTAIRGVSSSRMFIRNGAGDYAEFRSRLGAMKTNKQILVYFGGGGSVSSKRSIPMYLNEWHGLSRSWKGKDLVLEDLAGAENLASQDQILVVIDRTRLDHRYPEDAGEFERLKGFASFVEAEGQVVFSTRRNDIKVYTLSTASAKSFINTAARQT